MKILKIAALSLVMATPLAAQTSNSAQEQGQDPESSATPAITTPSAAAAPAAMPTVEPYVHLFSDEGITARLTESGYSDVVVTRDGTKLKINATRDGAAHEMVYDMTTGALVEVDGAGYSMGTPPGVSGTTEDEGTSAAESDN